MKHNVGRAATDRALDTFGLDEESSAIAQECNELIPFLEGVRPHALGWMRDVGRLVVRLHLPGQLLRMKEPVDVAPKIVIRGNVQAQGRQLQPVKCQQPLPAVRLPGQVRRVLAQERLEGFPSRLVLRGGRAERLDVPGRHPVEVIELQQTPVPIANGVEIETV